ncbi:Ank1 [Symbiodinium sp. CCMP2592]|nr:Ank1 [Symbiodinium sp. CCMP2592]
MLRVRMMSGGSIAALPLRELSDALGWSEHPEHPVRSLKRHLECRCGQSRFRQRLLSEDGATLQDDDVLDGHTELQLVLLEFGPTSQDRALELVAAATSNDATLVEFLLQRPQDPNLPVRGRTPLFCAAYHGRLDIVRLLLEASAETDSARCDDGATPLFVACQFGHLEIARLLLEAKADQDRDVKDGPTPLIIACQSNYVEVVRLLLSERADSNKTDPIGGTPLSMASALGYVEIIRLLLEANADKDQAQRDGLTPLFFACQGSDAEVVRVLLEARADKNKACQNGVSPLSMARMKQHEDVLRLLHEFTQDVSNE